MQRVQLKVMVMAAFLCSRRAVRWVSRPTQSGYWNGQESSLVGIGAHTGWASEQVRSPVELGDWQQIESQDF